jgi:adenylate cyclase
MPEERVKRKLTAILSADVKGYSRLMSEDEVTTVGTLKLYRKIMAKLIQQYDGRVVDSPGDNLLADFSSITNAVQCAIEIQNELKSKNAELPENKKMEFRIGVNLGDVIDEGERIYGEGINIASRLEGLSDEGGVCISSSVYNQVKNKLELNYEDIGEQTVKNIPDPIRVYCVRGKNGDAEVQGVEKLSGRIKSQHKIVMTALILLFASVAITIVLRFYRSEPPQPVETSSRLNTTPLMPSKTSIAVLPFENLSGDPEQEYFSNGIANDIITDLSRFRELLVIASNTSFTYKGKPAKIKDVGQELGVRYVLEGSVQKTGEKVRINAQLIDSTTGNHLWADRYERSLSEIFSVQDEIVQKIVAKLAVKIYAAERSRVMRKPTDNLEAYEFLLRGHNYLLHRTSSEAQKARQMFEEAIALDPQYAYAHVGLGEYYIDTVEYGWTEFSDQALQRAFDLAQKALILDQSNAAAHRLLGSIYAYRAQYDLSISALQKAIELNPNDADSYHTLGWVLLWSGRHDEAISTLKTSIRLDVNSLQNTPMHLGLVYYLKGRYEDAIRSLEKGVIHRPNFLGYHIALAAAYAQSGRIEDARQSAVKVLQLDPFFEIGSYGTAFRNSADREKIIEGLQKAGLK